MFAGRLYRPDDQNLRVDPQALPREIEVTLDPVRDDVREGNPLAVIVTGSDGESYVVVGTFEIRSLGRFPNGDPNCSYYVVRED